MKCEHVHKDAPEGAQCEDCYGKTDTLSDKMRTQKIEKGRLYPEATLNFFLKEDVVEFILRLKKEIRINWTPLVILEKVDMRYLHSQEEIIDKLAGDSLTTHPTGQADTSTVDVSAAPAPADAKESQDAS